MDSVQDLDKTGLTNEYGEIDINQPRAIDKILAEIKGQSEVTRRAEALKRHLVYKDGGKRFLLEQIRREFNEDAIDEMRLVPINLLKKIINKRSSLFRKPPVRRTDLDSDQALMDFYVDELDINQVMQKANRYFSLLCNGIIYVLPDGKGSLKASVIPSYLYSIVPNRIDRCKIDTYVLNAFVEEHRLFASDDIPSATGRQGYSKNVGYTQGSSDLVASNEHNSDQSRQCIFWSDKYHFTTNGDGNKILMPDQESDEHGLGRKPIVNFAKDRDNEPWEVQGEDLIDLTMAIQSGWTDVMSIAKHQGFAILTVVSEEEPTKLVIGVNKAIWLKQNKDGPTPSIDYKSSSSNLDQYKDLLSELLALLLSTNDMNPSSIGGAMKSQSFSSGFHALIEMADTLEAREEDKPAMMATEKDLWDVIKTWHNRLYDVGMGDLGLSDEAYALGKFSDDFDPQITFSEVKPIESEQERIGVVQSLMGLRLMTRQDAMKKLYPDLTDDQIDQKLKDIDQEAMDRMKSAQDMMGAMGSMPGQAPGAGSAAGAPPPIPPDPTSRQAEQINEAQAGETAVADA